MKFSEIHQIIVSFTKFSKILNNLVNFMKFSDFFVFLAISHLRDLPGGAPGGPGMGPEIGHPDSLEIGEGRKTLTKQSKSIMTTQVSPTV